MNKKFVIWKRSFDIPVVFDVYDGEEILDEQETSLTSFISKSEELLNNPSYLSNYLVETSNGKVTDPIDNIFKYVLPKSLFVKRIKDKRVIALLCAYKYDPEHGLAVVFENEAFSKVTTEANV